MNGDRRRVIRVDRAPGSLVIFYGRNSLHRVRGDGPRFPAGLKIRL